MLSKRQKTQNFVCWFVNGGGGVATGGSHFGLRRRALFITTFVFVKAKKNFFCCLFSFFCRKSEFGVSIQFPFPRKSSFGAQAPGLPLSTGRDISPGREKTTIRGGGRPRSLWAPCAGTRQGTQGPIPWGRLSRDLQERRGRGTWGLGPPGMLGEQDGGTGRMTS